MSHKDGDQTATTKKVWQPTVLGEWTTNGRPGDEVPILPVQVVKLCQNHEIQHRDGQRVLLAIH